jgi:hypothetical protein
MRRWKRRQQHLVQIFITRVQLRQRRTPRLKTIDARQALRNLKRAWSTQTNYGKGAAAPWSG